MTDLHFSKENPAMFSRGVQPKPDGYWHFDYMDVMVAVRRKPRLLTRLMVKLLFQGMWRDRK